jgi:hypothetical protein
MRERLGTPERSIDFEAQDVKLVEMWFTERYDGDYLRVRPFPAPVCEDFISVVTV